ncbi:MAG TPA: DivIVA domain-containing protein [Solirubrobacteraceae bacterium]
MELDRQAIERRDFPIARRGYDPAAVDAHLRAVAAELAELQHKTSAGGGDSLAATASSQVQSIISAAETAAAEIESQAEAAARDAREAADRDARATREEAIAKARSQVAAVTAATAALGERVGSMDAQASALVDSLRTGAERLAADLGALEANMGELYDAASGETVTRSVAGERPQPTVPAPPPPTPPAPPPTPPAAPPTPPAAPPPAAAPPPTPAAAPAAAPAPAARPTVAGPAAAADPPGTGDVDGARLIALNMALNGESRADTERYLAENYTLPDRLKLVDEVYAAIEG